MKLSQIRDILNADVLACSGRLEREVATACASDLMSDILAFPVEGGMMLTGLVNPQVIRTAEMMDMKAVVFVRSKKPSDEMIELASQKSIVIMSTTLRLYIACGLLFSQGLNTLDEEDRK